MGGSRSVQRLEAVTTTCKSSIPQQTSGQILGISNLSAGLRQIFPDASVRCPPSPLGGAAPGAERGKRERAGGLSSHAREATAVRPASAAAAHLAPIAGRSQDGGAGGAVLREGGRRGR